MESEEPSGPAPALCQVTGALARAGAVILPAGAGPTRGSTPASRAPVPECSAKRSSVFSETVHTGEGAPRVRARRKEALDRTRLWHTESVTTQDSTIQPKDALIP